MSRRLLDDEDGPMRDVPKTFHGSAIVVADQASMAASYRERLGLRFERFLSAEEETP